MECVGREGSAFRRMYPLHVLTSPPAVSTLDGWMVWEWGVDGFE